MIHAYPEKARNKDTDQGVAFETDGFPSNTGTERLALDICSMISWTVSLLQRSIMYRKSKLQKARKSWGRNLDLLAQQNPW